MAGGRVATYRDRGTESASTICAQAWQTVQPWQRAATVTASETTSLARASSPAARLRTHNQKMTIAAMQMALKKVCVHIGRIVWRYADSP